MNEILIDALMSEIKSQCEMVEIAVEGINQFHNEENVQKKLWFNVQALLIATANISKIIWSKEREGSEEVIYLKRLLEINNSSKIRSKFFSNLFEHYDQYLFQWSQNKSSNSIATSNVTLKSCNDGIPIEVSFKTYYYDVDSIMFHENEHKLQPVVKEITRIYDKIKSIEDTKSEVRMYFRNERFVALVVPKI